MTETQTLTIAAFLLDRIADEEDVARSAIDSGGTPSRTGWQWWTNLKETTPLGEVRGPRGSVEMSPRRALAECTAKRAIVAEYTKWKGWATTTDDYYINGAEDGLEAAVCALAAVYADHPSYDPSWSV